MLHDLNSDTYEDVERDGSATIQALLVVVIVAIASGIGGILSGDSTLLDGLALRRHSRNRRFGLFGHS